MRWLDWLAGRRTDGATRREAIVGGILGALVAFAIIAFFMPGGVLEHVARAKGWI